MRVSARACEFRRIVFYCFSIPADVLENTDMLPIALSLLSCSMVSKGFRKTDCFSFDAHHRVKQETISTEIKVEFEQPCFGCQGSFMHKYFRNH